MCHVARLSLRSTLPQVYRYTWKNSSEPEGHARFKGVVIEVVVVVVVLVLVVVVVVVVAGAAAVIHSNQ